MSGLSEGQGNIFKQRTNEVRRDHGPKWTNINFLKENFSITRYLNIKIRSRGSESMNNVESIVNGIFYLLNCLIFF